MYVIEGIKITWASGQSHCYSSVLFGYNRVQSRQILRLSANKLAVDAVITQAQRPSMISLSLIKSKRVVKLLRKNLRLTVNPSV